MSTTEQTNGKPEETLPAIMGGDPFKLDMDRRIEERMAAAKEPLPVSTLPKHAGIWLFSQPRTASNLFVQMMSAHTNMVNVEYEFFWGAYMPSREKGDLKKLSPEEKEHVKALFEKTLRTVVYKTDQAVKEGKRVFAKEHTFMCIDRALMSETLYPSEETKAIKEAGGDLPMDKILADKSWVLRMPGESEPQARTTPSMLPDYFLKAWLPVFLIRHPAKMVASQVRVFAKISTTGPSANDPSLMISTGFSLPRMLYDWYKKNGVPAADQYDEEWRSLWPIVLDAEDIVRDKAVLAKFCKAGGLDPDEIRYEWPSKSADEVQSQGVVGHFTGTLMQSTGVNVDLHEQNISIDKETEKWTAEFGGEVAQQMRKLTEAAMPDYLYLRERRLRA